MKERFSKLIAASGGKPILADGAMGTLLVARGIAPGENLDALNLERPELVAQAHRDYLRAGAQIVETNTYGANRFKLAAAGMEDKLDAILRAGVSIARREAGTALVAGSIGPLGVRLSPYGRVKPEAAESAFREQASLLLKEGSI